MLASNSENEVFRLFVIIVLYKMKPSESPSLRTLQAAIACLPQGKAKIRILLYDNTPDGQQVDIPAGMEYVADPENGGLAKAYNYALEIADKGAFDWLLTLDQDSTLPADFMCKLFHIVAFVAPLEKVAAVTPWMSSDGKVVSPKIFMNPWALSKSFPDKFIGISFQEAHAVNSASTIRVSALKKIGGYDPRFYLGYSDIIMYLRLYRSDFRIFVAGNISVEHELSGYDLKRRATVNRYEDAQYAEEAFHDVFIGRTGRIVLVLKQIRRLLYGIWKAGGGFSHLEISLKFLFRRLFYSRKYRLKMWNQSFRRGGRDL